jgi:hypothetical protein
MPNGGVAAAPRDRQGRGRSGKKPQLAALPDKALERERVADELARARLAAAAAAGRPLIAPDGRERSPITLPEYRRGRAPANKGKRYPAEVLTGEEVLSLMDAYPARTAFGAPARADRRVVRGAADRGGAGADAQGRRPGAGRSS